MFPKIRLKKLAIEWVGYVKLVVFGSIGEGPAVRMKKGTENQLFMAFGKQ